MSVHGRKRTKKTRVNKTKKKHRTRNPDVQLEDDNAHAAVLAHNIDLTHMSSCKNSRKQRARQLYFECSCGLVRKYMWEEILWLT